MCTWWRIAVTLVVLAWPALVCAQKDDAGHHEGDGVGYPYASLPPVPGQSLPLATNPTAPDYPSPPPVMAAGWSGLFAATPIQQWGSSQGHWHFTSLIAESYAVGLPLLAVGTGSPGSAQTAGVVGVVLSPLTTSYQIGSSYRVSVSMGLIVPATRERGVHGDISASDVWAMKPKVAYTRVVSASNADSSVIVAVGSFSRQAVSYYQNGAVGRIEALVMQRAPNGWSYGGVAAALQPLNVSPMTSSAAGYLPPNANTSGNGGYALGVGPQLNWSTRWRGTGVDFQYRLLYEFHSPTGHTDQPMLLSATLHL
ncbi:hypothetical protein [Dyella telluris]|uniref:Transporter n=1 Tax=Dyella telluris TaxID=2763498 RepID=A0A7G8Q9C5_9GAMM|nr:hypothetical protein [Dyella telluris]QNK03383.1 hypothetical protein H8F01_09875 [Dyella telluris]